jgi:hypothetical protein
VSGFGVLRMDVNMLSPLKPQTRNLFSQTSRGPGAPYDAS